MEEQIDKLSIALFRQYANKLIDEAISGTSPRSKNTILRELKKLVGELE